MRKPTDTRQLAIDILERSKCLVQVGATIADNTGIISWGWNGVGLGFGIHAEAHAILRANKRRLFGATIYVASKRKRNSKIVTSKPCVDCQRLIAKWELRVMWRDSDGVWNSGY